MTSANQRSVSRPLVATGAGLAFALCLATVGPSAAIADPTSELQSIQQEIQQHNAEYEEAVARVAELQGQIDENQGRIEELEAELPEARERAASSMRTLYKMQQGSGGLVEMLLSADTFYDLLSTIQYLDIIQEHSTDSVDELLALADELELTRVNLSSQMQDAEKQREQAETALAEATAARESLRAQIAAQAAAEKEERKAALEAAKEKEEAGESFTTQSGNEVQVETPPAKDPEPVDTSSDKDAFVSTWTARIDAYLAGSPLAGQGKTFAEAAWEYGADPRFSPAISHVESSKGRYCFKPHNAWGWGNSSWDSWEEAIWAHVRGLASGYGGQLTYAGAKKYCPPNADFWYATVLSEMNKI